MKKYLFILGALIISFCYSQPQTLQARSGGGTISILNSMEEVQDNIEGTPYIISEFLNAKVDNGTQLFKIRYNGFLDEMEFEKGGQIYSLDTDLHKEINFEGLNKKYIYSSGNGFLLELFKGNNFVLYRKEKIEFKEKKQASTSFQQDIPAKYIRKKDTYFIQLNDGNIIELPKSKNKITELVNDKKAVNDYMKKNNINISEENDLVFLFKFIDTLE